MKIENEALIFRSLDEFYDFVETDWPVDINGREVSRELKLLSDTTSDEYLKNKIHWEKVVFDFFIQDGKTMPMWSTTGKDGVTIHAYPTYDEFDFEAFEYLKDRVKIVQNDYLIARYNHVLWDAPVPHKHQRYAQAAVDAYLRILMVSTATDNEDIKWDKLQIFKNAFGVASQVKYRIEDFKSITRDWLFGKYDISNQLIGSILDYMVGQPLFRKSDFTDVLELVADIGSTYGEGEGHFFWKRDLMETGLKVANRINADSKVWHERIGDACVELAIYRLNDETRMIPLSFYWEAVKSYKKTVATEKVRNAEKQYFKLKKELKLAKIEVPLGEEASEKLWNYIESKVDALLKNEPDQIIAYLVTGGDIFPKKEWLAEMGRNANNSFLDLVTTLKFDINTNLSKAEKSKDDVDKAKIFQSYSHYLNMSIWPQLNRIFIKGIGSGKISFEKLIKFMTSNTWLGQELTDYDSGHEMIKYNWMSVIAPSLLEYFVQTESALKSRHPYTNYVLVIDSLTLKFEGVLRDFARHIDVSTTILGKGDVLREKYIEELLAEEEIEKYFDETDILFFKFLFVEKDGLNLRNNVAHSFFRYQNYSIDLVHLLICAFLRIGKYRFGTPE